MKFSFLGMSSENSTTTFLESFTNLGSATTFTTVENGTTYQLVYPCHATETGVCGRVLKSSSSHASKNGLTKLLVFLLMLVTTVFGSLVKDVPLLITTSLGAAIDEISESLDTGAQGAEFIVSVDGQLTGISNFTIRSPDSNKRSNKEDAQWAHWTQHQVVENGTWWTDWSPASCVQQNENSEPETLVVLLSSSHSATWDKGFHVGLARKLFESMDIHIVKNSITEDTQMLTVPAQGYGQAWEQQLMAWQDQQHQKCHKKKGSLETKCGTLKEYRGNFPVQNSVSYGWTTGLDNMDFNSCGGGI